MKVVHGFCSTESDMKITSSLFIVADFDSHEGRGILRQALESLVRLSISPYYPFYTDEFIFVGEGFTNTCHIPPQSPKLAFQ